MLSGIAVMSTILLVIACFNLLQANAMVIINRTSDSQTDNNPEQGSTTKHVSKLLSALGNLPDHGLLGSRLNLPRSIAIVHQDPLSTATSTPARQEGGAGDSRAILPSLPDAEDVRKIIEILSLIATQVIPILTGSSAGAEPNNEVEMLV